MDLKHLKEAKKIVGMKQTRRAIATGEVVRVYLAKDADGKVKNPILELCHKANLEVIFVDSMKELGTACGIEVGAASVAIIK